jgi:hypothetical protein
MERNIHLIFKTHLDVGFTDYASAVTRNYFKKYIPAALRVAREMRDSHSPVSDRFIWTTGSWLIYEYLEQASDTERKEMEAAILAGDIAWHALPFTTHTELMDAELFRFGLSLSKSLDTRFGRTTIAAKMTDVPGHTRAIIPLLAEAGVVFLHIGVNPGSTVPSVPGLFRWRDPDGSEIMVMYESGYGSAFEIPGLDHSLAFGHTMDNMGPQSSDQVRDVYREIRAVTPGANIFASTLSDFAAKLMHVRETLPVVTYEIGDTWIHGTGSDPIKVSRYRELLRLRSEWLANNKTSYANQNFFDFSRRLLMVPEHTWGMDEKTYLGDHENYSAEKFTSARDFPNFKRFESSWVEKRAYPQLAVNALEESPLAEEARVRLQSIRPQKPVLSVWQPVTNEPIMIQNDQLGVTFNNQSGCIGKLTARPTQREWVHNSTGFGQIFYQSFSAADYERFFKAYIINSQQHDWAREDFTKPGLKPEEAESRLWIPSCKTVYSRQGLESGEVLFQLGFESQAVNQYGAPGDVFIRYSLNDQLASLNIDVQWFNKKACRLPEALWFSFQPSLQTGGEWRIEKLGREISPLTVVENGNRHLHACGQYVVYRSTDAAMKIFPLDSPLVAPGQRSLLNFNNDQPDLREGVHFCLLNNLWGTNFPMWFEEDCRFRFKVDLI